MIERAAQQRKPLHLIIFGSFWFLSPVRISTGVRSRLGRATSHSHASRLFLPLLPSPMPCYSHPQWCRMSCSSEMRLFFLVVRFKFSLATRCPLSRFLSYRTSASLEVHRLSLYGAPLSGSSISGGVQQLWQLARCFAFQRCCRYVRLWLSFIIYLLILWYNSVQAEHDWAAQDLLPDDVATTMTGRQQRLADDTDSSSMNPIRNGKTVWNVRCSDSPSWCLRQMQGMKSS